MQLYVYMRKEFTTGLVDKAISRNLTWRPKVSALSLINPLQFPTLKFHHTASQLAIQYTLSSYMWITLFSVSTMCAKSIHGVPVGVTWWNKQSRKSFNKYRSPVSLQLASEANLCYYNYNIMYIQLVSYQYSEQNTLSLFHEYFCKPLHHQLHQCVLIRNGHLLVISGNRSQHQF